MVELSLLETPWGFFGYAVQAGRLAAAYLPEPREKIARRLEKRFPDAAWREAVGRNTGHALLPEFRAQVLRYFAGEPVDFAVDVDLAGVADFHRRVLLACRKVPFGGTITYGGLASKIGHPGAARAVGQAMAANPIPLVIPCHRVVAANGRLGGFSSAAGCRQKLRLLQLENPMYQPAGTPVSKKRKQFDHEELFAAGA